MISEEKKGQENSMGKVQEVVAGGSMANMRGEGQETWGNWAAKSSTFIKTSTAKPACVAPATVPAICLGTSLALAIGC